MIKYWLAKNFLLGNRDTATFPPAEALNFKALEHPLATDSYYFYGVSPQGYVWVARLAARSANQSELWFALRMPNHKKWIVEGVFPSEPGKWPAAHGLSFERKGAGWLIRFQGSFPSPEGGSEEVRFKADFEPSSPIFDFSQLRDKEQIARALASMPWNKVQFEKLKSLKTSHIEQAGNYTCRLELAGESHEWQAHGARDHSTGHRDWDAWTAHSWFTGFDTQGRGFNLSLVQFSDLPVLRAGYCAVSEGDVSPWVSGPSAPIRNPSGNILLQNHPKQEPLSLRFETLDKFIFKMGNHYQIEEGWGYLHMGNQTFLGILERGSRKHQSTL